MKNLIAIAILGILVMASTAIADTLIGQKKDYGLAWSNNFTVVAPRGDNLADDVLRQAEKYRKQIAIEWLGKELPEGAERTHIRVEMTTSREEAFTMLCGPDRRLPGDHWMTLKTTSREGAIGSTLAHEVAQVVLNGRRKNAAATPQSEKRLTIDFGVAGNANFVVLAPPGDERSDRILERASHYRRVIAKEFYGHELADGIEHACIHVRISDKVDKGKILLRRSDDDSHMIWLNTNEEGALGPTLKHEICHVVLHARFPTGMPAWANEGLASYYDSEQLRLSRQSIIAKLTEWPSAKRLLDLRRIKPSNACDYAAAESLTNFLVSRGGRRKFLRFVSAGVASDWNESLSRHYAIGGVDQLQKAWQRWVK